MPETTQVPELLRKLHELTELKPVKGKDPFVQQLYRKQLEENIAFNAAIIAKWEQLLETDVRDWRWVDSPPDFSLADLKDIALNLADSKYELLILEDRHQEALNLSIKMLRFARSFQLGQDESRMWTVGSLIHLPSLIKIQEAITGEFIGDDSLETTQRELTALEFKPVELNIYFRHSYQDLTGYLDAQAEMGRLNRNTTLTLGTEIITQLLEVNNGGDDGLLKAGELTTDYLNRLETPSLSNRFHPNANGLSWLSLSISAIDAQIEHAILALAYHRMTIAALAVRRFELAHGKLPEKLEELVPEYIASTPLDPYNGQPIRWNKGNQTLYSVYENKTDDGGHIDVPGGRSRDRGVRYPWSDAARETRAKSRADKQRAAEGK